MELHFSNLRNHLPAKIAVEKSVKTGSDVNSKTKCRFLLILTRWTRIYAYLVILAKTDRYYGSVCVEIEQRVHNKMTECSFNALAFLFFHAVATVTWPSVMWLDRSSVHLWSWQREAVETSGTFKFCSNFVLLETLFFNKYLLSFINACSIFSQLFF